VSYTVIRPGNHYASRLPAFGDAPVVKLVTPRLVPARLGEYLVVLPAGGGTVRPVAPGFETFVYALEGTATLSGDVPLGEGAWAYLPARDAWSIETGDTPARLLVVKRRHEYAPGFDVPPARNGHRDDVPWADTDVPGFRRRELLPVDDPSFDFAMSLLAFDPGIGLPFTEIHDEEHGLYMTAGGGTYLLDGDEHEVAADDFIYMPPYCPQGFSAAGHGAEYLLYKDTWRDGF